MFGTRELLKQFIMEKVKQETSFERPYFIVKWSGLNELCKIYNEDLLSLIDELVEQGKLKKALIPTKNGKKILAVYIPGRTLSKKTKKLITEFEVFRKK